MSFEATVRRCPECGEPRLRAVEVSRHVRRGETVGKSGVFKCSACGAFVSIAEPAMNLLFAFGALTMLGGGAALGWFGLGLMDGYGAAPLIGGFLGLLGVGCAVIGAVVGWFGARMILTQLKSPVV